jgi:hypothetical protein
VGLRPHVHPGEFGSTKRRLCVMAAGPAQHSASERQRGPSMRAGAALGVVGSLLVHVGLVALIVSYGSTPDLGFEFELPAEVEFGVSGSAALPEPEPEAPAPEVAAPETPPEAPDAPTPEEEAAASGALDAGLTRDAGRERDAGVDAGAETDAGVDADAGADGDAGVFADGGIDGDAAVIEAGVEDAGAGDAGALVAAADGDSGAGDVADAGRALASAGDGGTAAGSTTGPGLAAYAPPGAQLALRLDLVRMRQSALAPDIRALLAAVPDWQALLDGSGIEPLDDLERLLIASPNLQRAQLVMSGRYVGDVARVREAVARMATARGVPARWRRERGTEVAPWPDADETERVIALVGPQSFTITRSEDLPRVIAVARERRREAERIARETGAPVPDEAAALLSMVEGEVVSLEVEGARAFVRGATDAIPLRARGAATELDGGFVAIRAEGSFEDDARAEAARVFWDRMRASYARNPFVALVGLSSALERATLRAEGATIFFETQLEPRQVAFALRYLRGMFERPRPGARPPSPGPGMPPANPSPRTAPTLPAPQNP